MIKNNFGGYILLCALRWHNTQEVYFCHPSRGRGGSSETSPPLLRSSGLSKNLLLTFLTSIFLPTVTLLSPFLKLLAPFYKAFMFLLIWPDVAQFMFL